MIIGITKDGGGVRIEDGVIVYSELFLGISSISKTNSLVNG